MNFTKNIKSIISVLGLKNIVYSILIFYFKLKPKTVVTRDGIKYSLDRTELIDRSIYFGAWEKTTIKFIKKYVKPGFVVIEVGANVGSHTLTIAKCAGDKGKVFAFEPTNFARKKLQKNISLNHGFEKIIKVENYLVTDNDNHIPNRNIKSSWNVLDKESSSSELVTSESISLDFFYKGRDLSRIDVIKIDVDGYDFKVISGAEELLKKFKPVVYIELCEYALNEQGDSIDDIFSFFNNLGYTEVIHEDGSVILDSKQVKEAVGLDSSINGCFMHK